MRSKRLGGVTAAVAMVAALAFPTAALASPSDLNPLEQEFYDLLEAERTGAGVPPLALMDELVAGARAQAVAMAEYGDLFHNPDLGSVLADGWAKLGENVGFGYSAPTLHDAFMNSPGHRDNVIDPAYDYVGIGTVEVGGAIYVAFVFADMLDVPPPAPSQDLQPAQFEGVFFDDDGSPYEAAIERLAVMGITSGCADGRFCPDDPVTRGQMAVFLGRAVGLEEGSTNRFADDDGSVYEGAIEALASAGITAGCAPGRFCPDDPVTRGQMAAFLSRVLGYGSGTGDSFRDDDGSPFEPAIEALAAAGITKGCDSDLFCPDDPVTRGQMAVFLTRAFDS